MSFDRERKRKADRDRMRALKSQVRGVPSVPAALKGRTHLVIGDTQVKPGVPTDHLGWIGRYIVDQFAGQDLQVVHVGDHWDVPSLSSYDRGKKSFEGRRYKADIYAGNGGFARLNAPLRWYNSKLPVEQQWWPNLDFFLGNHEYRVVRACEDSPELDGVLSLDDLNAKEFGWKVHDFRAPATIDGVTYCLAPHHKVLMSDLTYKSLSDVEPGDKIVGFDEHGRKHNPRKFRTASVLAVTFARASLYRVTLRGGKTFEVTGDHRWLARKRAGIGAWEWLHTHELAVAGPHTAKSGSQICKPLGEWARESSYDAGWLAGLFDGEGCLSKSNSKQGGIQLSFSQNEGVVLERARQLLSRMGVRFTVHAHRKCKRVSIGGTSSDKLALLERIGATRLLAKFKPEMLGRVQNTGDDSGEVVVSVESIGEGDIVQLKTSSETLVVEGFAHHNCHYFYHPSTSRPYGGDNLYTRLQKIGHSFTMGHQQGLQYALRPVGDRRHHGLVVGSCYLHEEEYLGPQVTKYWRGIVVCHQVEDGQYDPMFVSLDYLCRKYEGVTLAEFMNKSRAA